MSKLTCTFMYAKFKFQSKNQSSYPLSQAQLRMKLHLSALIEDVLVSFSPIFRFSYIAVNYVPTYEMNVSTNFSRFKCIPFCLFSDDDSKFIRGGCVAQLRHSELGGVLCSDDQDFTSDGLAEVFLWKFKGKENDTENFNT